jgi:hypothetical protein
VSRFFILATVLLASCSPVGLGGPDWQPAEPGTGPCFEADLSDGIDGGAEIGVLFDCLNEHGAFEELAPMVDYLVTSERVSSLVSAVSASLETFDVPELVRTTSKLVSAEDAPLSGMLDVYVEVYDDDLLPPLLAFGQVTAAEIARCEASEDPAACSVPTLAADLLDGDAVDLAGNVVDALGRIEPEPDAPELLQVGVDLILDMSPRTNPSRIRNPLLELGEFLLDPDVEGGAPADQLLDVLDPLIRDDALVDDLVVELARLDRIGAIDALPNDLRVLFTRDVEGNEVGFEGESIVDALLGVLGAFDLSLLDEEIALGGEPVTLLELALDLAEDLYQQQADVAEIVAELQDVTDLLCGSGASNALCDLTEDLLPPITAAVEQTEAVPQLVLPLVHVLQVHTDLPELLGVLEDVLAWDLLGRAEPLLAFTVEQDLLDGLPKLVPVFLQSDLGQLQPAGRDALELVRLLLGPEDAQGPLDVLLPFGRVLLDPPNPDADLDVLLVLFAQRIDDPASALSIDNLVGLIDGLLAAVDAGTIDPLPFLRDLLDARDIWLGGAELLADEQLIGLLRPDDGGGDAPWWLRDLIERGVVDRILSFLAGILDGLTDLGLLDP